MGTSMTRIREFTWINLPEFHGSKVDEYPQEFIDEVYKIVGIMGLSTVFGLRNKIRTQTSKKERSEPKEGRKKSLVIAKSIWRVAEWPVTSAKVPVC
uniref:Uncharacterized protein n=1 Tax=Solanum tuberosum TaxID=4113 RepID=M1DR41_SOLTU